MGAAGLGIDVELGRIRILDVFSTRARWPESFRFDASGLFLVYGTVLFLAKQNFRPFRTSVGSLLRWQASFGNKVKPERCSKVNTRRKYPCTPKTGRRQKRHEQKIDLTADLVAPTLDERTLAPQIPSNIHAPLQNGEERLE